ncbi:RNA polymerase sigma factor [Carboxylicivirga linearis]|uniref:RNA polymerase sigma factor n=2 Tax=Carboxylicivirga linearis TaxID=1628157 RepID=A0ABS5JZL0_9BACT|nr:RNA polymerase sigma factor [Carboxylicivirga linearis]
MFYTIYRYLNNEEDAAEVLNDGFYKVFSQLDKFKKGGITELLSWTKRIMINESLQLLRRRKELKLVELNGNEIKNTTIDCNIDLETKELFNLITKLPSKYRIVFNLYVVEGYNHKDISEMMNISESTSRSYVLRARLKLQEIIKYTYNHELK